MKAWEIWSYKPPEWTEAHPAVIISHPARVLNKLQVNLLMCASKRATRNADASEVILDQSDGLNWPTICHCDLFFLVDKADLRDRRGTVTVERQRQIIATINRANGWI